MFNFPRWVRLAFRAKEATSETLQSIGGQAYARVQVAQRVLTGEVPKYEYEDGPNGRRKGSVTFGEYRYDCGFLNSKDATTFLIKLQELESLGYRVSEARDYALHPDNYRLDGWVLTVVPPRCNATYCEDWSRYPGELPAIDLGAIQG